jgi:Tfp pilus assembly protein PilF
MPYLGSRIFTALFVIIALAVWINFALSVSSPGFDMLSVFEVGMPLLIGTTFTRFGRNLVEQLVEGLFGWLPFFSHHSMPMYKLVGAGGLFALSLWLCFSAIPQWATQHYYEEGMDALARNSAQAEQHFRRVLSFDPDHPQAHYELGGVLERLFRYDEAIDAYQRAIQIDEHFFDAYNNLARLYLLTEGDYTRALAILERGRLSLPYPTGRDWRRYTFYKNRAWAYFGLGLLKSAERDLNAALSFYDIGANAYCLRAQVYRRQGRPEEDVHNQWKQCLDNNGESYENQDSPPGNNVEEHWLGMAGEQTEQFSEPQ